MSKNEKPFGLGIIVGRFQVLHQGHGDMIRKAASVCSRLAVFTGSSQESKTLKNPLSYEMRKELLLTVFPDICVFPLPDIGAGNNSVWGEYVLKNVREKCGCLPDLIVTGYEARRTGWIEDKWNIAQLIIPKTIDISATAMIQFMIEDNRTAWCQYIEPALKDRYEQIRTCVLDSMNQLETMSI